jgi:hypothetical protein
MQNIRRAIAVIGASLSLIGLAACIPATPTIAPTIDTNPLRTQVAATVFSQVTQDLALTPSATPPPTATPPCLQPLTQTLAATGASEEEADLTATLSITLPEEGTENRVEWVSQSIADKTVFAPGETFTMTWSLKNTGFTTWTPDYVFRFFSGDPFGAPREVLLNQEVPPGEIIDIVLQMKAPAGPGTYTSVWVMSTENRSNFKEPVYLEIVVTLPATNTPAP